MSTTPIMGTSRFTYEKPALNIIDPTAFEKVRSDIDKSFSSAVVVGFLKSVERAGLRIRNFEDVLAKELLGKSTSETYNGLLMADQGQIREFYLASLECVGAELRQRFFKLYSYY